MMVGTKVKILKVRTSYLQQWVGHEAEVTGLDGDKIYVSAGDGSEKKHLTLKPDWFEILPVRSTQDDEPFSITSTFIWFRPGKYWIDPNWVKLDLNTQCRVQTDKASVKYYASQMESNLWEWEASPVGLLWDGEQLIPYDGHHRIEAAMAARQLVLAIIDEGDLTHAVALSCGSNKKPSLRRTPEDNRKTIAMLEDLRKQHGDEWLLSIINADLPEDKQFRQLSLRAMEAYTGIPFRTIKDVKDKVKKEGNLEEKPSRIAFTPTPEEIELISSIMDIEGFEKPSDVFRWLLQNYQES